MSATIIVNAIDTIGVRIPVRIGFQQLQYQFVTVEDNRHSETDS